VALCSGGKLVRPRRLQSTVSKLLKQSQSAGHDPESTSTAAGAAPVHADVDVDVPFIELSAVPGTPRPVDSNTTSSIQSTDCRSPIIDCRYYDDQCEEDTESGRSVSGGHIDPY